MREVELNKVLTEGAEPTPLEMNVLCRVSVGRTVTLQLLLFTTFVLYPEQRIVLDFEMVYLLLVSFQLPVKMLKVIL